MLAIRTRLALVLVGGLVLGGAVQAGGFRQVAATAAGDPIACVAALRADRAEAFRIIGEQADQFNATTVGSALSKAYDANTKALRDAVAAFFKAYQYAYKGSRVTANTWVKNGNAAIARANAQVKIYNGLIDGINATTTQINADHHALETRATSTDSTCQGF